MLAFCRVAVAVAVAVAGMVGCLIPLSSAASNVFGLRSSSVDCHVSSPLRLIAAASLPCCDYSTRRVQKFKIIKWTSHVEQCPTQEQDEAM
jgi:hypothetical protein